MGYKKKMLQLRDFNNFESSLIFIQTKERRRGNEEGKEGRSAERMEERTK
jgi:hypothetical protein